MKPDQTKEQQFCENLLLWEWIVLIDAGTDSKSIRVYGNDFYVGQKCHATVRHGILHKSDSLGDHSLDLEELNVHVSSSPGCQSNLQPSTPDPATNSPQ